MIDLVFCLECTSSMAVNLNRVREMLISVSNAVLARNQNTIHLSLIQFRSCTPDGPWMTKLFASTKDNDAFKEWLDNIQGFGGSEDECEAIGKRKQVFDEIELVFYASKSLNCHHFNPFIIFNQCVYIYVGV